VAFKTLEGGLETEVVARDEDIGICTICHRCLLKMGCVVQDAIYRLYPLMRKTEEYFIAARVYNGGINT
jgi:multimeric flavodoxin WrbA